MNFVSQDEWRKLGNTLTKWEDKRIREIIQNNRFTLNAYSRNRIAERNILELDIHRTIKYGNIIEFHYKKGSPRVLIRGKEIVKGESICVVLDIKVNCIVTVYKNCCADRHKSLHKELYSNRDIMRYLNVN